MERMVGKFLVGRHTSINGRPCTMICGVIDGHHIVDNDNHNAVLAELFLGEHRVIKSNPFIEDLSPEDFLENGIGEIDWKKPENS